MKCPACLIGRLAVRSTPGSDKPGRTVRYRKCRRCGRSYPTLEVVLAIHATPSQPRPVTQL